MTLSRRSLLMASAAVPLLASGEAARAADASVFTPPAKGRPMLLSFNENPLGLSPAARKAVAEATAQASRYPFVRVEVLRKAMADFIGGTPANILPTHGSAEAIRASVEAYIEPGVKLVVPELTYSDGEDTAKKNGLPVVKVPMGPKWSIDVPAMKAAAAKAAQEGPVIVYFVNPNNPTSTACDGDALLAWIREKPARTMFLVDEAYAEFADPKVFRTTTGLVKEGFENVVVLKTFSKIFAMAGLRLGFAYAAPKVIKRVKKHVAYDIMMNNCTIEAALAELNDADFLKRSKAVNDESRKILTDCLDELGLEYLPSQTNFVFVNLKAPLKPFADRMMKEENIMVGRPFPPAVEWCRISLGLPEEMKYFTEKLRVFREKGWV